MARSLANLDQLKRKLAALPGPVKTAVLRANVQNADELMDLQRDLVPKKSGALADSIRKEAGETEASVLVLAGGEATTKETRTGSGQPYDYALGVEFGTEAAPAEPFFFPAYRALKSRMKARASRAALKAVREVAASGGGGST